MATLSVRLDDKTKDEFAKFCDTVGMSVSTLFSVFAKTVVREQKIPFEISAKDAKADDGFYSEANQRYLEKMAALDKEGKLNYVTKTWEELKAMAK
ncbi:MAG: type II toxin-antitoxin system RelB/DinJ family antitoxin [Treponema sp.]|nr:type II toxin-antitoxin system RelB/DinJ family antitoxin [Treponema sp.]